MNLYESAYAAGAHAALEKHAASRAVKEIRRAIAQDDMGKANRIAKGGLAHRSSPYGTSIKDLGRGGESFNTLVHHPEHGFVARKEYDLSGAAYHPELVNRKAILGQAGLPNMATFRGELTSKGGTPMQFYDYVHGKPLRRHSTKDPVIAAALDKARAGMRSAASQQGMVLGDLRPSNAVFQSDGTAKFVDYTPYRPGDMSPDTRKQFMQKGPERFQADIAEEFGDNIVPVSMDRMPGGRPELSGKELTTRQHKELLFKGKKPKNVADAPPRGPVTQGPPKRAAPPGREPPPVRTELATSELPTSIDPKMRAPAPPRRTGTVPLGPK